jgi:transcriptional regulator with XRE-family HTH domain
MTATSPTTAPEGNLRERVAEEIRALMARRRVTQTQLAAHMGVSQSYVSRRLLGQEAFDLDDLDVISAFFGVAVVTLLTGQITPKEVGLRAEGDRGIMPRYLRRYLSSILRTPERPVDLRPQNGTSGNVLLFPSTTAA